MVKNSIIMQDGTIKKGALVDNCIADKMVTISEGRTIIGAESYPIVFAKQAQI